MRLTSLPSKFAFRIGLPVLVLSTTMTAQMGNGMMGPGPGNSGSPGQTNGNGQIAWPGMGDALMGAMNMGMSGREMMEGPAVGPDGTAYVIRSLAQAAPGMGASPQPQFKHELVAVNSRDGSARWKLEIAGGMLSEPVVAKDGKIFLTLAEYPMSFSNGTMSPRAGGSAGKSKLLIVSTNQSVARISATIELESDVLSAPKVAADESGSYVVYVAGFERNASGSAGSDNDSIAPGEKHLYAFNPDGQLRFRLKLGEARVGVPAN